MKERPILFSAPMVRALLNCTKSQTRRAVKLTEAGHVKEPRGHRSWHPADPNAVIACPYGQPGDRLWVRETWQGPLFNEDQLDACQSDRSAFEVPAYCRYAADGGGPPEFFDADDNMRRRWRPSIHMPRWASRITLEIVGVRIERLQDVSDADAIAEGIERNAEHPTLWKRGNLHGDQNIMKSTGFPKLAYRSIWEQINGHESWSANPLVWVVEFKRVDA